MPKRRGGRAGHVVCGFHLRMHAIQGRWKPEPLRERLHGKRDDPGWVMCSCVLGWYVLKRRILRLPVSVQCLRQRLEGLPERHKHVSVLLSGQ